MDRRTDRRDDSMYRAVRRDYYEHDLRPNSITLSSSLAGRSPASEPAIQLSS